MILNKSIKHFKLLTATPAFLERIKSAGSKSSVLHARLVVSWLAHRARLGLGASTRSICEEIGLHPKSVASAIQSLGDLVRRRGSEWIAVAPPESLFVSMQLDEPPEHWGDRIAYTMLYLPRKGVIIQYPTTVRRFTLNHALIWSFLHRTCKKGRVTHFTFAGAGKLFGLTAKTVASIVDDLVWMKMISREDLGRSSNITLLDLAESHLSLFQPIPKPPVPQKVEPVEKKPRSTVASYQFSNDSWDAVRRQWEPLMPQKTCDSIIGKAIRLGDSPEDVASFAKVTKERHDSNIKTGKVAKGNFGKYLDSCYETRIKKLDEQLRREAEEQRRDEYLRSDEFKAQQKLLEQEAAADPMHDRHILCRESILDRVQMDEDVIVNRLAADNLLTKVRAHIRAFVRSLGKNLWVEEEIAYIASIQGRIMKPALASLNRFYRQQTRATADHLRNAIDDAIAKHASSIPLMFKNSQALGSERTH